MVTADRPALDTFVAHLQAASDAAPVQLQVDFEEQPYVRVTAPAEPVADAWDYEAKPEGPPERRRLWIACATKSFGEVLVRLCKRVGATKRFYHAGVGIKGVADKNPTAAVMTVGDKSTSVKGIFQQQAKTVANLRAAARPDLTVRRKRRSTRSCTRFSRRARARRFFIEARRPRTREF